MKISRLYGCEIEMDGESIMRFPSAKQLFARNFGRIGTNRSRIQMQYIMNAAKMVNEGKINLEDVCSMDTVEARDFLMRFQGVGPKVADCTLLYSGTKYDVFPTDVW